jgi:hypothetical protein
MKRRTFVELLGGVGMMSQGASGQSDKKNRTRFYVVHNFYLKNGPQVERIHQYLSKTLLPALNRRVSGPKIFLEALVAPHMPQVAVILGFQSLREYWQMHSELSISERFGAAYYDWENGPEAPMESYSTTLLEAADYSPEIEVPSTPPKTPRIFELRVYHSPSNTQLSALHVRFAGPEIKIFHRVGVHPLFYSSTVFGLNKPNLTYLIPFDNLAAREKAWSAFSADPDWIKVRRESIEKHGQISSIIQISLYKATPYSPIR